MGCIVIIGEGFKVIVNSNASPSQLPNFGITVYVTVSGLFPVFINACDGIVLVVPFVIKPLIFPLETADQEKVVFVLFVVNIISEVFCPEQISCVVSVFEITGFSNISKV